MQVIFKSIGAMDISNVKVLDLFATEVYFNVILILKHFLDIQYASAQMQNPFWIRNANHDNVICALTFFLKNPFLDSFEKGKNVMVLKLFNFSKICQ